MGDFLKTIVEHVAGVVEASQRDMPLAQMRDLAEAPHTTRNFSNALSKAPVAIIAEVKRASPSKGDLAPDLDAAEMAQTYEEGGAAALSVLTEARYFKGTLKDLKAARAATPLPVLRKEFIIDPYQIYEAAAAGADAVLLIARILEKEKLSEFLSLVQELNMDSLVEIFDEKDAEKIAPFAPELVGINNRNLKSFETDTTRASRIARVLPAETQVVAASGIARADDIRRHLDSGISCFLVGESLVRAKNPAMRLRQFIAAGERS